MNYIPAALDAGLMPLLVEMLAEPDMDCNARSAVMRSLRLITSKASGVRTVLATDALHQTVLDACVEAAREWRSRNDTDPLCYAPVVVPDSTFGLDSNAAAALQAATDALHIAANLWTTGEQNTYCHIPVVFFFIADLKCVLLYLNDGTTARCHVHVFWLTYALRSTSCIISS
jgi:hypothetical protein